MMTHGNQCDSFENWFPGGDTSSVAAVPSYKKESGGNSSVQEGVDAFHLPSIR